jgi:ribosomal protein S18 acetylase RimI-like enzyme
VCDARAVTDVLIERSREADPALLRDLWLAVHRRHIESMPELEPYVDDDTSWAARRSLYTELLAKPDTILLLARDPGDADRLVGYGLAYVMDAAGSWIDDTWVTAPRVGEIESVGLLPAYRNRGLGTLLMDRLEAELRDIGIHDLVLGVLAGNDAAIRLYERRGFRQTWLYMSRWSGREGRDTENM